MSDLSSREVNYFKIGTFALIGIVIFVIATILLGSHMIFSKTLYIETYFDESVQGLTVGSPVKYRGLDIGYVKRIAFVNEIYNTPAVEHKPYDRYIYVLMAITSSFLTQNSAGNNASFAAQDIQNGLRIKLALQGLTGNVFAEINFVDPKTNPPLPIAWTPKYHYIPSAKSTLTHFSDNVQTILDKLQQVDFQSTFSQLGALVQTTNEVMQKTDSILTYGHQDILKTIDNLQAATQNLNAITDQAKQYPSQVFLGKAPPKLNPKKL